MLVNNIKERRFLQIEALETTGNGNIYTAVLMIVNLQISNLQVGYRKKQLSLVNYS